MNETLDAQKERTVAEMVREIDRYYEELSQGCSDPACDINGFERMGVEHRKRTDKIFLKALSEAMSSAESEVKKSARNAAAH